MWVWPLLSGTRCDPQRHDHGRCWRLEVQSGLIFGHGPGHELVRLTASRARSRVCRATSCPACRACGRQRCNYGSEVLFTPRGDALTRSDDVSKLSLPCSRRRPPGAARRCVRCSRKRSRGACSLRPIPARRAAALKQSGPPQFDLYDKHQVSAQQSLNTRPNPQGHQSSSGQASQLRAHSSALNCQSGALLSASRKKRESRSSPNVTRHDCPLTLRASLMIPKALVAHHSGPAPQNQRPRPAAHHYVESGVAWPLPP